MLAAFACSSPGVEPADAGDRDDRGLARDGGDPEDVGPIDGGTEDDFARISDDFESGSLDPKWHVHRPDVAAVRVESGQLALTMQAEALWFQDQDSVLVFQEITGDFAVEAAVHAESTQSPGSPPNRMVHLGGLMARDGESSTENYVFVVVGFDEDDLSVETKSTTDGHSDYFGPAWGSGAAELRLCRNGAQFRLFKRPIGGASWELAATYPRPDLPRTLQVGANAYAFGTPDLTVRFDAVVFSTACP